MISPKDPALFSKSNELIRDHILQVASLFEGEFTLDWLVELTELKAHRILAELQQELKKKILASPSPGIYFFPSSADRERFQKHLSITETNVLHGRIANLLIRDLPEEDGKLLSVSRHLLHILNDVEYCRILTRAGNIYRDSFRNEQALHCYTKVLKDLAECDGEEADRLFTETAIQYSKISTARHETTLVLDTLHDALKRAKRRDDRNSQSLLEMHIAKNEWLLSRYSQALSHFKRGWAMTKTLDDPKVLRSASSFGTIFLYWQGRFREAVESYVKALPEVERFPHAQFPLLAAITVGYCYAQTGQMTQGLGMLDAIRTHCLERGDRYLACQAIGNIGEVMLIMRRIDEAQYYLEHAVEMAAEAQNRWVWIMCHATLAFVCLCNGESDRATQYFREYLRHSRKVEAVVHPYPYRLAMSHAMSLGQIPAVEGLCLEAEIERSLQSNNIFLKGIAYRYQALLRMQERTPAEAILHSFQQSIQRLNEAGHPVELARTRMELAHYFLSVGKQEKAMDQRLEVSKALSSMNDVLIPNDLRGLIERPPRDEHVLKEILELGRQVVNIRDNNELMQRIISMVNRVTGAERGAMFLFDGAPAEGKKLCLRASKNLTPSDVTHPSFGVSTRLIEEVAKTGEGSLLGADAADASLLISRGVIRSMVCVPMVLHDQVIGVLYHDNRLLSSAFRKSDLELLAYFAALAAIAIDNARAYEEIRSLNRKLNEEKKYFEEEHLTHLHFDDIVGQSPAMQQVLIQINQVAETNASVLITGETGVGKELVARAIHRLSPRKDRPFISVQLSSLPDSLIPSELFGHEKGAYTGATQRRIGRFELADGGTLFLDEIGDIPAEIQVRLLRVLQNHEFERIGGTEHLTSDFRLITATNRDLEQLVRNGTFRADLYYRLKVFPIHVPPLREREGDVPLLAKHFLKIQSNRTGKRIDSISDEDMKRLNSYEWPGNVRELENLVERGVILSTNNRFHMPGLESAAAGTAEPAGYTGKLTLADNERCHILRTLEETGWKISGPGGAAEVLNIPPSTLSFRMKKLGISRQKKDGSSG
ncbi:MAG TPA: hypothetical protein DCR97_00690 [Deltaproteobacteria bacterium]|jgi:transcriptional regulator with GAF, ATPase, and Fis domain|nr:hypothetical protein [Deltaproteobacteria bacterium]